MPARMFFIPLLYLLDSPYTMFEEDGVGCADRGTRLAAHEEPLRPFL